MWLKLCSGLKQKPNFPVSWSHIFILIQFFFLLKALGYIHKLNITELQPEILRLQTCGNREAAGRAVTVDRMMTAHVALLAM